MTRKLWPGQSGSLRHAAKPIRASSGKDANESPSESSSRSFRLCGSRSSAFSKSDGSDFSNLPNDILTKIAASFRYPELQAASLVCKSWSQTLKPLRESMLLLRWGKRYKHGHGVRTNLDKALDSFLKGADRGSTLAMVDAGLMYWEMGKRDEGMALYMRAAVLGDPAGQCNLAISYLKGSSSIPIATFFSSY